MDGIHREQPIKAGPFGWRPVRPKLCARRDAQTAVRCRSQRKSDGVHLPDAHAHAHASLQSQIVNHQMAEKGHTRYHINVQYNLNIKVKHI